MTVLTRASQRLGEKLLQFTEFTKSQCLEAIGQRKSVRASANQATAGNSISTMSTRPARDSETFSIKTNF